MVDAAEAFLDEKNIALFERTHVFTAAECHSRHEIMLETYSKNVNIDAAVMLEMVERQILPAALRELDQAAGTAQKLAGLHVTCQTATDMVSQLSTLVDRVSGLSAQLARALANVPKNGDARQTAAAFRALSAEEMSRLRSAADQLEEAMPASAWPVPSYTDLLFDL